MKQLNPSLYENLTAKQRVIASIEAEARGDSNEVKRLIQTCPKSNFKMNDPEFSDAMEKLFSMDILVQRNMLEMAVYYYYLIKKKNAKKAQCFAQRASNMETAWQQVVEARGVDYHSLRTASIPMPDILDLVMMDIGEESSSSLEEIEQFRVQIERAFSD